jgi:hypothetical protein
MCNYKKVRCSRVITKDNDSAATFENASNGMPLGNENLSLE